MDMLIRFESSLVYFAINTKPLCAVSFKYEYVWRMAGLLLVLNATCSLYDGFV